MVENLERFVRASKANYTDIRYESKTESRIHYSSRLLKEIGANTTDGYVIRIIHKGGMASMAVTKPEDIKSAMALLMDAAKLSAKMNRKPVKFASTPAEKAKVKPKLGKDPRNVSIEEKLELLMGYNDLMLAQPEIHATEVVYSEVNRAKRFVSSEGADISEELMTVGIGGEMIARKGDQVRNVRVSIGGAYGMKHLLDRDEIFLEKAKIARELLKARSVKGGNYDVVLNPSMTGVFTHEAFGHFSEADLVEDNAQFRKMMKLGKKLGSRHITIIADSTMPNLGFYKYDDEGVAVRPVTLMNGGVLAGRLHSRKTAASFDEPITGHCVAEDHDYPPIIRMGNIYVKPGKFKFDELLETVRNGLYLCDGKGGQTTGEGFTFGTQYGYVVKNGELGPMIRDTNIMGNLFTTLKNICAVGNDLTFTERGGCGKGQTNIKSSYGGPHAAIRNAIVGGE